MLSEHEFKNKHKKVHQIILPPDVYVQVKSENDKHFMNVDKQDKDNFIELTDKSLAMMLNEMMIEQYKAEADKLNN
ncbi:hypothetical protein R4B61_00415 [Fructilactobacillus vespulae]|uniref:hypothetical protein n=1 Tax=Fructilactobacillus vespulae TaxID=1249630 RepID=UPI0039B3CB32